MILPAIRGYIGTTVYYTTNIRFKDLVELVNRLNSDELYNSKSLKDALQRSLTDNYIKIKEYILKHKDHFFNAMVLAVFDGDPRWKEVRYEIDGEMYSNVGLLELNGKEKVFPLDGQHRLEGIKAALKENREFEDDTIPIMLIGHDCSAEGMAKSRRIFSILNRYAKPVGKGDIIALDEDDIVAIATRELLETFPLFTGNKIKVSNSKSIPHTDKGSFTTLMTLYDCMDELFKVFYFQQTETLLSSEKLKDYKRSRPSEDEIKNFYDFSLGFWTAMSDAFSEIKEFMEDKTDEPAKRFRPKDEGGNMLFRPVGLLPLVSAVCQIMTVTKNSDYRTILSQYASFLDRNVASEYWTTILWDANTKKMIVRNGSLTKYLLIEMYSHDVLSQKDIKNMIERYASIFNLPNNAAAENRIFAMYRR